MELKYIFGTVASVTAKSFNRTFMELKLFNFKLFKLRSIRFNRTFMELKSLKA